MAEPAVTTPDEVHLPVFPFGQKAALQLAGCAVCLGVLYFSVFRGLVSDWISLPDFSHGFIVPLISLYIAWERRADLLAAPVAPANSGIILLLGGIALLLLGTLATEFFTMRFSLLVVIAGMVVFLLGWAHFKILLLPLLFLVFMIPIPSILLQKITFPMQFIASSCAAFSLHTLGIPALREGNVITLANTSLEVAEACSGIRSLMALLALGVVFAHMAGKTLWHKALLIVSCLPIAIVVNALRVSATGVLAHYYGIAVAEGFFHEFSGFVMFGMAFILLFALNFGLTAGTRLFARPPQTDS